MLTGFIYCSLSVQCRAVAVNAFMSKRGGLMNAWPSVTQAQSARLLNRELKGLHGAAVFASTFAYKEETLYCPVLDWF